MEFEALGIRAQLRFGACLALLSGAPLGLLGVGAGAQRVRGDTSSTRRASQRLLGDVHKAEGMHELENAPGMAVAEENLRRHVVRAKRPILQHGRNSRDTMGGEWMIGLHFAFSRSMASMSNSVGTLSCFSIAWQ